jgi:hypothetical protein
MHNFSIIIFQKATHNFPYIRCIDYFKSHSSNPSSSLLDYLINFKLHYCPRCGTILFLFNTVIYVFLLLGVCILMFGYSD